MVVTEISADFLQRRLYFWDDSLYGIGYRFVLALFLYIQYKYKDDCNKGCSDDAVCNQAIQGISLFPHVFLAPTSA